MVTAHHVDLPSVDVGVVRVSSWEVTFKTKCSVGVNQEAVSFFCYVYSSNMSVLHYSSTHTLPHATCVLVRVLLRRLTSGLQHPSSQDLVIISSQITPVISRVISGDSGQMKSDSSFSEGVFVTLHPSCKLLMLRLWDLNTVNHFIQNLQRL